MFLLYSLPLYFFLSFVGASDVKQPLQVLQTAVVAYISSPLRTFRGAIIIDDASASGTHRELSELLVKCPRDNAYKWGSMVDFLVQLGVSKPKYDSHVILSVKTSFRQILEKCQIGFDGEFQKARSWDVPLQKVSDVFNAHAPPRTSMKLNTHDAQYNFLVFLLMHWKLAFGNPPNNNVNTLQVVGQSPATTRNEAELVMPTGEAGANDFFVTTLNSEALKVNAVKEKVASASKPSLVFSIPVLNPNTINANQGPFSSSYASQPNAHIWQERGQQHQTVSNHPLVNHNKSTSRLSGKLPQAIVYPDELAQSTGFDGHRKLKRMTYSTKDESSNKKPRVDKFVSTPSVVAPAIENINSYSSVSGNTSVSAYVQPLDVLKEAVELYSLSPLRTLQGSAIIDIPSASNTHNALSMLLVKFPRGNSIETGCFDDFLVELGFPRPPYVNAIILSVKASFLDILQKCRIEVDVDYKNASSWDIPLIVVGDVFKAYAPLWTTTKLKTQDDHYNFLIFLLMHWKLKYGVLPDFNCLSSSHEETLTEYNQMTFIANLPMVKTVNTPSSSKNTNFLIGGYSPEMLLLQQSHTNQVNPTTNNNYMATSRIAQPISISKEQYYNPYFPVRTDNPMSSVLNGYGGSTLNGNLVLPNAQQFQYSTNNVPTTTSIYHTGTLVRNILEPKKPQSDNQREKLEEPARIDNLSS